MIDERHAGLPKEVLHDRASFVSDHEALERHLLLLGRAADRLGKRRRMSVRRDEDG